MKAAFYNSCVRDYSDGLMGYAYRICGERNEAEDAVQEAFLRLWKQRNRVNAPGVKSWLYTCVYRILIDNYRKSRRVDHPGELPESENPTDFYSEYDSREIVNRALGDLSQVQRSIVVLKDLEGYKYEEIAELMDLSLSQVKVYLFRARKKLKVSLEKIQPDLIRKTGDPAQEKN